MRRLWLLFVLAGVVTANAAYLNYSVYRDFTSPAQGRFTDNVTELGQTYYGTWNLAVFNDAGFSGCAFNNLTGGRIIASSDGTYSCTLVWKSNANGKVNVSGWLSSQVSAIVRLQHWMPNGTVTTIFQTTSSTPTFFYNVTDVFAGSVFRFYSTDVTAGQGYKADNVTFNGSINYGYLFLEAKDELTLQSKPFNVTISNATNSTLYISGATYYWANLSAVPSGDLTLSFVNYTCLTGNVLPRSYDLDTVGANASELNFTAYLLCDSSTPINVVFAVQDTAQRALPGALVTASRSISGVMTPMTSRITDSTGLSSVYLDQNTAYQITASLAGYSTFQQVIFPSSTTYTIRLSGSNDTVGFQTIFDGLFYSALPDYGFLYGNFSNVSFYLNDSYSQLNFWGWNVTYQGLELYSANWTSNFSGGFDYVTLNMTDGNKTGNVTLYYWFSRANFTTWNLTRTYLLNPSNLSDYSMVNSLAQPKANGASNVFLVLISCIIISFLTSPFSKVVTNGAGLVALLWMGIFVFMGAISWALYAIVAFTWVAWMALLRVY